MKKFSWKEFGSEFLGGIVELAICLSFLFIGYGIISLFPESWQGALDGYAEMIGLVSVLAVGLIIHIIKEKIKNKKNKKD